MPPARGCTPAPRPNHNDYRYTPTYLCNKKRAWLPSRLFTDLRTCLAFVSLEFTSKTDLSDISELTKTTADVFLRGFLLRILEDHFGAVVLHNVPSPLPLFVCLNIVESSKV